MMGEFRKNLRQSLAGILARGHGGQFRVRMRQEQTHQFLTRVTGRPDNPDFDVFIHSSAVVSYAAGAFVSGGGADIFWID